jgi:molybdate transport system regulatory protein
MTRLKLRIDFRPKGAVGPGKIALLEAVARDGSISAAARSLDMSYRRAWLLIDSMNALFRHPVVTTAAGGRHGGGAELTGFGRDLIARYRKMEAEAGLALAAHIAALEEELAPAAGEAGTGPPPRDG